MAPTEKDLPEILKSGPEGFKSLSSYNQDSVGNIAYRYTNSANKRMAGFYSSIDGKTYTYNLDMHKGYIQAPGKKALPRTECIFCHTRAKVDGLKFQADPAALALMHSQFKELNG